MRPAPDTALNWQGALAAACLLMMVLPASARAFERMTVVYGLREYGEYNSNVFPTVGRTGSMGGVAINTEPDLSLLYDDGKTRLLARGSYRRESFFDQPDASGNYYAFSGEFSRTLDNRVTFSLVGGYRSSASIVLGEVLQEPGQRIVARPTRGMTTVGTFWSPSVFVLWSRRFGTTLTYDDSQTFTQDSLGQVTRSISLSGFYVLTPNTTLNGSLVAYANRNSGVPLAEKFDSNSFLARFGLSHTFSPRLTMELSAGPQWTKEINLPRNVTVLYNGRVETVVDPVFGLTAPVFVREAGRKVQDVSLGISFNFRLGYRLNDRTSLSIFAAQGTTSNQGAAAAQQTQQLQVTVSRALSSKLGLNLNGYWLRQSGADRKYTILFTPDPFTGETQALDPRTFDINTRLRQRQVTFESRLTYKLSRWIDAYTSWNWTEVTDEVGGNSSHTNRVQVGLEFRKEAYY